MFGNGYTPLLLGCQCVVLSQTSRELSQFGVSLSLSLLSVHRSLHSLVVVATVTPGGRMLLLAPWCYDYVGGSYLSSASVFCKPCSSGPYKQDFVPSPPVAAMVCLVFVLILGQGFLPLSQHQEAPGWCICVGSQAQDGYLPLPTGIEGFAYIFISATTDVCQCPRTEGVCCPYSSGPTPLLHRRKGYGESSAALCLFPAMTGHLLNSCAIEWDSLWSSAVKPIFFMSALWRPVEKSK